MTWIKICGITNLEDARTAVEAGADALGFVFWEKSPRWVDPETARQVVAELPERVEKVGVFVDTPQGDAIDVFNTVRLTAMQRHLDFGSLDAGQGSLWEGSKAYGISCYWRRPKFYMSLSAASIVADERSLGGLINSFAQWGDGIPPEVRGPMADLFGTFFLDSGSFEQPGGTGRTFDWIKAAPLVDAMQPRVKAVIAGGLNPTNVAEAIRILHPWGVDVASGVEARPGKKDPEKVRAFVRAVRTADGNH
jgi:phosphoribosylanthranilate isomerase